MGVRESVRGRWANRARSLVAMAGGGRGSRAAGQSIPALWQTGSAVARR